MLMLLKSFSYKSFQTINKFAFPRYFSLAISRIPAGDQTLDTQFISEHYETVISHLKSRKASLQLLEDTSKIAVLRTRRNALIVERDSAKNSKKNLSQLIGKEMKGGNEEEVKRLKNSAEDLDRVSDAAESQLQLVDDEIDEIVAVIPNLIDDRYNCTVEFNLFFTSFRALFRRVPEGTDDTANLIVREWGTEKRQMGDGNLWHDEIAVRLGGLDVEAAARISGARFSVLKGQGE